VILARAEALDALFGDTAIDEITDDAYALVAKHEAEEQNKGLAAKDAWHLSFHASRYPGDDPVACGRQAIYGLLDPQGAPTSRKTQHLFDEGTDIEHRHVERWYRAGRLLSAPPFVKRQDFYEDPEHWLTSTVDALTPMLNADAFTPTELKTKDVDVVKAMVMGERGPDPQHVRQNMVQLDRVLDAGPRDVLRCQNSRRLAVWVNDDEWGQLDAERICPQHRHTGCLEQVELIPLRYGYIHYIARGRNRLVRTFRVNYDEAVMRVGRERLAAWRGSYLRGVLPQVNWAQNKYAHPNGKDWGWSKAPCKWCDFQRLCRDDMKASVELGGSLPIARSAVAGVASAHGRAYADTRAAVLRRWGIEEDPCDTTS
jgi:hypothetical protein